MIVGPGNSEDATASSRYKKSISEKITITLNALG